MAERIAQLQEALLHCGKFQDALEPLLSWLSDTEELVANQKPPSAEYRVVKAQIQEQKVGDAHIFKQPAVFHHLLQQNFIMVWVFFVRSGFAALNYKSKNICIYTHTYIQTFIQYMFYIFDFNFCDIQQSKKKAELAQSSTWLS